MECPKCHKIIDDNTTVCPHCRKVIALVCPNCKSIGQNPVCEKCGYIILEKCSKCGKPVSTEKEMCRCGFPVEKSIAYSECETDEFASITISFMGLKTIRRLLKSEDLYKKFILKIRNLMVSITKSQEGKVISYGDTYVINMNKELSFPTSSVKAVKFALTAANAFTSLNAKIIDELGVPLQLNININKKSAEKLLVNEVKKDKIKQVVLKKTEQKYLKGMQLTIDQYVYDVVHKEYATDSLYSTECEGKTVMLYELLLEKYVIPPSKPITEDVPEVVQKKIIKKKVSGKNEDAYMFKVFDINAECKFERATVNELFEKLDGNKITSIRSERDLSVKTSDLIEYYELKNKKVLRVVCTENGTYKPWYFFDLLIRSYFNLSMHNSFLPDKLDISPFVALQYLLLGRPRKAASPEDARFAYMEDFGKFLNSLDNCVIIVENFELMDDTSIQALSLYFDSYKKIIPDFVFLTDVGTSLHSKFKGLLRTPLYTEYLTAYSDIEEILADVKEDASDFIESFYFEKIKENFAGSNLYFENALKLLIEKNVLINFENKLLIRNKASILIPMNLEGVIRERLKILGNNQNASLILAYSVYLGYRLDFKLLEFLGVEKIEDSCKLLIEKGFVYVRDNCVFINNYSLLRKALITSMSAEAEKFLCKTLIAKIGKGLDNTTTVSLLGNLSMFKEEYLILWRNSQYAMAVGDFDAYLKNCMGFLSLLEYVGENISKEDIEENKKEVYQNILMCLYGYSPEKIYSIEKVLLLDAIKENDDETVIKLSNLMLQGALISSNYTDAMSLMHNILSRMKNPTLIIDGAINTKFLLLSLVNIEIMFNIGDFRSCIEIAADILKVLSQEVIEQITPPGFSKNFFALHLMETFRVAAIAKIIVADDDLEDFFMQIKSAFNEDFPEQECLTAIVEFLKGKTFALSNAEDATPFAKAVYMILQQIADPDKDYKNFAQNCYQAKLLTAEIHQTQLERLCDLLIAYAYSKIGIKQKAFCIYKDVMDKSENSAIFNSHIMAKYFMAILKISEGDVNEALQQINDSLALIQRYENQAKVFYALFEKLFIEIAKVQKIVSIDINTEERKLALIAPGGELSRITGDIKPVPDEPAVSDENS